MGWRDIKINESLKTFYTKISLQYINKKRNANLIHDNSIKNPGSNQISP